MSVIYKMVWKRFNTDTLWFDEGYKGGVYKNAYNEYFNKLVSQGKLNSWNYSVSGDNYELTLIAEFESLESLGYCKSIIEKKFPNYFENQLEYNLEHGIFCDPERCGISIDNGPFVFNSNIQ